MPARPLALLRRCLCWSLLVSAQVVTSTESAEASVWRLGTDAAKARCTLSAAFGNGSILAFGLAGTAASQDEDEDRPSLGLVIVKPARWPIPRSGPFLVTMVLDRARLSLQATLSADRRAVHVALPPSAEESFASSRSLGLVVGGTVQTFELADLGTAFGNLHGCNRGMTAGK